MLLGCPGRIFFNVNSRFPLYWFKCIQTELALMEGSVPELARKWMFTVNSKPTRISEFFFF